MFLPKLKAMKKYPVSYLALLTILFLTACSTGQRGRGTGANTNGDTIIQAPQTTSLTNMLARAPGVSVRGDGPNAQVRVRGGEPLYVLDGVRLGRNFAQVFNAVDVNNVTAIEVLKDPAETIMYGRDGAFGVIVIHTGNFDPEKN